jgi:2-octaprenyl-6-methoxyphenol hydroxylase
MSKFDVVIVGGAMSGATLALALNEKSHHRLKIAVVEASDGAGEATSGFDSRAIALSHGTVELFKSFSLWSTLYDVATPIKTIHVSDRGHLGRTTISSQEEQLPALGYVVELHAVGLRLEQKLTQAENITLLRPDRVSKIEQRLEDSLVELQSGRVLEAKLLVAADGTHSSCCEMLKLHNQVRDFAQTALIANIALQQPHGGQAFERFTSTGPLALLPMSEQRMSLVWCLPAEQAARLRVEDEAQFLHELQNAFGWRLGKFIRVGQRASYPLALHQRESVTSHRFAVIGNAAQTLHPIAGQGFNLGIRDIASLVDEAVCDIEKIGDYAMLKRYSERRAKDRSATASLTTGLVDLFSNDWLTTRVARNLGLIAANTLSDLKRPLLHRTLGKVAR